MPAGSSAKGGADMVGMSAMVTVSVVGKGMMVGNRKSAVVARDWMAATRQIGGRRAG